MAALRIEGGGHNTPVYAIQQPQMLLGMRFPAMLTALGKVSVKPECILLSVYKIGVFLERQRVY